MNRSFKEIPFDALQNAGLTNEAEVVSGAELWGAVGDEMAILFAGTPHFDYQVFEGEGWYVVVDPESNQPRAITLLQNPEDAQDKVMEMRSMLIESGARPLFILPENVARAAEPVFGGYSADDLLAHPQVGRVHMAMPLERKMGDGMVHPSAVHHVRDREDLSVVHELVERSEDGRSIFRGIRPDFSQVENIGIYLLCEKGVPVSTVTTVRSGKNVGVWNMATDPAYRNKGLARTVLQHALAVHAMQGAQLAHLLAMPDAEGFYDRIGFTAQERAVFVG